MRSFVTRSGGGRRRRLRRRRGGRQGRLRWRRRRRHQRGPLPSPEGDRRKKRRGGEDGRNARKRLARQRVRGLVTPCSMLWLLVHVLPVDHAVDSSCVLSRALHVLVACGRATHERRLWNARSVEARTRSLPTGPVASSGSHTRVVWVISQGRRANAFAKRGELAAKTALKPYMIRYDGPWPARLRPLPLSMMGRRRRPSAPSLQGGLRV
jgi:hypothetical protein